jgi:hypothetical protein
VNVAGTVPVEDLEVGLSASVVLVLDEFVYMPYDAEGGPVPVSRMLVYDVPDDRVDDAVPASDEFALVVP